MESSHKMQYGHYCYNNADTVYVKIQPFHNMSSNLHTNIQNQFHVSNAMSQISDRSHRAVTMQCYVIECALDKRLIIRYRLSSRACCHNSSFVFQFHF